MAQRQLGNLRYVVAIGGPETLIVAQGVLLWANPMFIHVVLDVKIGDLVSEKMQARNIIHGNYRYFENDCGK